VRPDTIAKSLATEPGRRPYVLELAHATGGSVDAVSDDEIRAGVRLLAETTGIFTETAGGVTTACSPSSPRGARSIPRACRARDHGRRLKTIDVARGTFETTRSEPTVESFDAATAVAA